MKLRSRRFLSVPKERPSALPTDRKPLLLPSIHDRHSEFDDQILVSPEFRQIRANSHQHPPAEISSSQLSIAHKLSGAETPRLAHPRLQRVLKPSIVAKCEQSISLYESIKQRIRQSISERYVQEQREGMEIIHDRLMRLL